MMIASGLHEMVSYNMDTETVELLSKNLSLITEQQQFVSSPNEATQLEAYSFYADGELGTRRTEYDLSMEPITPYFTCKNDNGNIVLRPTVKKCDSYQKWAWKESLKGSICDRTLCASIWSGTTGAHLWTRHGADRVFLPSTRNPACVLFLDQQKIRII